MTQAISGPTAVKPNADEHKARENRASAAVSVQALLGSLRLNLTQRECSDGGLNG